MKFMTFVKGSENAGSPPQALFHAIDALMAEQTRSGVLVEAGGLRPTSEGARVRSTGGKLVVRDGPFTEAKEVIGGYAVLNAGSRAEAIELAKQFMALHVEHWPEWECECEVRQLEGS